nr:unnamed protein product [Callosobruchus analis]
MGQYLVRDAKVSSKGLFANS